MRRTLLGVSLAMVGASLMFLSAAAHGEYPTGLSGPVSVVLGITGGIFILLAIIALIPGRRSSREGDRPYLSVAALAVGIASLLAFIVLVVANLEMYRDHFLPAAARFVPVSLGIVAGLLGVLGIGMSRGDTTKIRASAAALVMGLGSAIVPVWLWTSYCYLFEECPPV